MTTQNQAVEAAVEQLMELHDDAAEARHTQGAPEYNSKSSQARKALAAAIRAMLVSAITQHPVQPAPLAPAKQLMTDTQAQEIIDSVSTFSGSYELAIVRATEAALGHSASGECGGVQVKPLTDEQVYWIAQSHGIGVHTCDVLGFYADLISTTPPVQVPLTEAQIQACLPGAVRLPQGWLAFARAIEAAHGIVAPAPSSDDASGQIKTGFCKLKAQPGGCPMNNLQCGWPDCDKGE